MAGLLIAGPVGAMLGGMSGMSKGQEATTTEEIERIDLIITHRDVTNPAFQFKCYEKPRWGSNAEVARQALRSAMGLYDWLNGLKDLL